MGAFIPLQQGGRASADAFKRAVAPLLIVTTSLLAQAQDQTPSLNYWHLWTGKDGKSHLTQCTMTAFVRQSLNQQLQIKQPGSANITFAYNPKGDWHENPHVQWVVPLQGAFYIKAQDGTDTTMTPGTLYLGEDLDTTPDADGHKGHISANKSAEPLVLMIAQLDVPPVVGEPCHIK